MTEVLSHCRDEVLALALLSDVQAILASAIDSLGNRTPPSIEAAYLFHTAVGLSRVAEGFHHLQEVERAVEPVRHLDPFGPRDRS